VGAAAHSILGGRYELIRPLAAGGMGTVWLGRHIELETDVAIKLVDGVHALRPDLLERFRREARAAAQLKTPHVVQILDYGVDGGVPYIAMELLDGEDLDSLLERQPTLSPVRVLQILRPLCRALGLAHGAGIVHRDLKPANVFLAKVTDDEVVKLVDFGIAKELHRGAEWATGAAMVGSPLFMSPEQIGGSANVDARTDVWSLSVMAYLMLFGEPPFHANGIAAIFYRIAHDTFEPPSTRSPGLAPFDAFFQKGLARKVRDRYATVAELLVGFEQAVAQLADPNLAVDPTTSPIARSGTVAMSDSELPGREAFAASASKTDVSMASSHDVDDDAATRAVASLDATPPRVTIPVAPRVASSKAPPASRVSMAGVLIGVVVGLGGLAIYVAQSGDDHANSPVSAASTSSPVGAPSIAVPAVDTSAEGPAPARPAEAAAVASAAPSASTASPAPSAKAATGKPAPAPPRGSAPAPNAAKPAARPQARPPAKTPNVDPEWGVPLH
jgi:serine/threonine protein kinase